VTREAEQFKRECQRQPCAMCGDRPTVARITNPNHPLWEQWVCNTCKEELLSRQTDTWVKNENGNYVYRTSATHWTVYHEERGWFFIGRGRGATGPYPTAEDAKLCCEQRMKLPSYEELEKQVAKLQGENCKLRSAMSLAVNHLLIKEDT